MTIVGEASIIIVPETAGFSTALKAETAPGLQSFGKDAEVAGATAGANLRGGVPKETRKLGGDLEEHGKVGGERLAKGMSGGLGKLAGLVSATGLPLTGLSTRLEQAGKAAEETGRKSSGLTDSLSHLGGYALLGVGAAAVVGGAAFLKM